MMFRQQIYYFLAVVEHGSFSAAAKSFYLSQSAISQQISKLEDDLKMKLFDRSAYRPKLTRQGQEFYELCKSSMDVFEKELHRIQRETDRITIGITGPFEKKHVPVIIKEFKKEQGVPVSIKLFDFAGVVENLLQGNIEIGFGLMNDFEKNDKLRFDNIYEPHICAVTSTDHRFASRDSVTMEEIKAEPLVVLSSKWGANYYQDFIKAFQMDGVEPNIVKVADNLNEFMMSIEMGEGIGLTAKEVVSDNDGVTVVDLKNTHHKAFYSVAMKKDNANPMVLSLYERILDYFKLYKYNL